MGNWVYIGFLSVYIVMIVIISVVSRKKVVDSTGFLLGGRAIPSWMSAFSYGTAYFSAVLFIGYAGKLGWNFGYSVLWISIGNTLIGSFLAWQILGKKTREMTQRLNASTMPEFLEVRYKSKSLKTISAIIIFVFLLPYAAGVYKGLGYLFEEIFGIPQQTIYLIMVVLTAFYLFVGGFIATSIADFIQGCIMIVGVILLLFYVLQYPTVGGFSGSFENLVSIDPKLVSPIGPPGFLPIFALVVLTSLGSWGLPQMVHKFYTIKNEASINTAKWVSTVFALLITFGAYFTGSISRLVLGNVKPESYDMVIPMVINKTLPIFVAAVILILVLSASMSTLASVVLASSSAIAVDLIKPLRPDLSDKKMMFILRILCVVFVIGSYIMANSGSSILNLASISWGAVSGCLLAPYLLGLYWKRATKTGAFVGIITALGIETVGVLLLEGGFADPNIPLIGAMAIILPIITMGVTSLITPAFGHEHISHIFDISKAKGGYQHDLV